MKYAFVDVNGIVNNIIVYDPALPHGPVVPSPGCTLQQINDWVEIGQSVSAPQPTPLSPTPAQLAAAAINAGIILTSTSTSALNGTYPIHPVAQQKLNGVETYILKNNTFPGGVSQMPWLDMSGNLHVFPSTALFSTFATAVTDYIAAVNIYGDSNGTVGSLPSNNITIA